MYLTLTQLRRLIMTQMPKGDSFRDQLLKEIEESDELIQRELLPRGATTTGVAEIRNYSNISPKRSSLTNGFGNGATHSRNNSLPDTPRSSRIFISKCRTWKYEWFLPNEFASISNLH